MDTFHEILGRFERMIVLAAAHKCSLFTREIVGAESVFVGVGIP